MTKIDLARLRRANGDETIEIAPRVWWVGAPLAGDPFQCHCYLVEQGDQSVFIDPGSRLTWPKTLEKIRSIMDPGQIRYLVCHHQDPDITACLPELRTVIDRDDLTIVTHWRTQALLKHYGLSVQYYLVDEHDWKLPLQDRTLEFVFTPYAHFPGAFCTYDPESTILFSSDLFGGFTSEFSLLAEDETYFEAMQPFHEHYMPSRDILDYALVSLSTARLA